ncbi:MAG: RNA polymerase sigma factor [Rhizobiaceae bacterium]
MSAGSEATLEAIYRTESRRVLATLIRLLGGFDPAEEAMHDAFAAAADQWPRDGVPKNPFAWLVSAGRFKAIDRMRRQARHDASLTEIAMRMEDQEPEDFDDKAIADDQLRLVFICCHPALPSDARTALTLREVCGLTTEEIAAAFLVPTPTIAQRIVRAKARIRDERIPYETPAVNELAERLEHVLRVVYLVFNEGYSASSGASLVRTDLSAEAIRLGRLLAALLPDPETVGLLALMLLHDSRRAARAAPDGSVILFEDQDRALWDRAGIEEGSALAARAFASGEVGAYAIQAAIAAEHAQAEATDWARIVSFYDLLLRASPTPVVELNRAAAIAMRDGPDAGLSLIDALLTRGELRAYHPAHAARGELLRRLGRIDEAAAAYREALALVRQEPARRFIEKRLTELGLRA